jgi:hypothetical protein
VRWEPSPRPPSARRTWASVTSSAAARRAAILGRRARVGHDGSLDALFPGAATPGIPASQRDR